MCEKFHLGQQSGPNGAASAIALVVAVCVWPAKAHGTAKQQ